MTRLQFNPNADGKWYCPTCGRELCWDSSGEGQQDETVNYYHCQYCGSSVEQYECAEEDKHIYPFYNKDLESEYETIIN